MGCPFLPGEGGTELLAGIAREDDHEQDEARVEDSSVVPMAQSISRLAFFMAFLFSGVLGAVG